MPQGALRANTEARTLADVVSGADVFLGCSAPACIDAEMVKTMADKPIILALANPEPGSVPNWPKPCPGLHHRHRPLRTTPTRSTTSCASPTSSAAHWTAARPDHRGHEARLRAPDRRAGQNISEEVANAYAGKGAGLRPDYLIPRHSTRA